MSKLDKRELLVARQRALFNSATGAKNRVLRLSFDELLDRFSLDCNTFQMIGIEAGVSRERIRQIYWSYFAVMFPRRKSGLARQKVCRRKRISTAKANLVPEGIALEAAIRANDAGKSVQAIAGQIGGRVYALKNRLRINGLPCRVLRSTAVRYLTPKAVTGHYQVHLRSLSGCAFLILLIPDAVFVIPANVLKGKVGKSLYVPAIPREQIKEINKLPGHDPEIDYWRDYRERWDLIPDEKS